MRLFVRNKINPREKLYLRYKAATRFELRNLIRSNNFKLKGLPYSVNEVMAESGSDSTVTGAILGGVIGLIGGPAGVAIGATAGSVLGKQTDNKDDVRVERFNKSQSKWQKERG